ncbi:alpha/beta hydrolase [Thermotoga sp.]|uniref:alpha/beta hydrolase n=1 Tax=Thermotoga sp. TaxID=28240 RepID=UPI0025CDE2CE|nr:alpha/beta hydrolase [Thermotoga sp.]MCD6551291.1 alpha/beta hydrolase [Thermotoga sp.]
MFDDVKMPSEYSVGYVHRGKKIRVSILKFDSTYSRATKGTDPVEVYIFSPKRRKQGSVMILQGLGSQNVLYLIWMAHYLSKRGIEAILPVLPGNFTRVASSSVSGKDYFSSDLDKMTRFWEHAVVDLLSLMEFLKARKMWHGRNCLFGYCLGGMIAVLLNALSSDFKKTVIMMAGGDFATLFWKSPTLSFVRRELKSGKETKHRMASEEEFHSIYQRDVKKLDEFSSVQEMLSSDIHPLLKIDPLAYAKFVDTSRIVMMEAMFDRALPKSTRDILWEHLGKPKRIKIPSSHVSWLPFQILIARYVMKLVKKQSMEN